MNAMSDHAFRKILYQTWQEDWQDKRGKRIESVRKMVEKAQSDNGIAIVIPARTTGKGPTEHFLKKMDYKAGSGFAPHPLFEVWVESQLTKGIETLKLTRHVWYPSLR